MESLRIVNVMFGRGQGGIEQAVFDYAEALTLAGHQVHTILHPRAAIKELFEARGQPFYTLSNLGSWDISAIWRLRRLLKHFKPHLSIVHGNRSLSLLRSAGAPRVVAALHNYKIKCALATAAFYPTQDLMKYARVQKIPAERLFYVPNMVRLPARVKARPAQMPPVIGSMGRFVTKKGFDVFVEALSLLKAQGVSFKAVLAGDGEEAESLKAQAARAGLADTLLFSGWVKNKQTFFDDIDIFCLPSLHEPFGIVLLEAMAAGLPCVVTDSEGPREIIRSGSDGVIVPMGDARALARELAALLTDPARTKSMAEAARDTVRRQYDLPVVSGKLDLAVRAVQAL